MEILKNVNMYIQSIIIKRVIDFKKRFTLNDNFKKPRKMG